MSKPGGGRVEALRRPKIRRRRNGGVRHPPDSIDKAPDFLRLLGSENPEELGKPTLELLLASKNPADLGTALELLQAVCGINAWGLAKVVQARPSALRQAMALVEDIRPIFTPSEEQTAGSIDSLFTSPVWEGREALRREIDQISEAAGKTVTRLTRLFLILMAERSLARSPGSKPQSACEASKVEEAA